jgi:hypothetical protein
MTDTSNGEPRDSAPADPSTGPDGKTIADWTDLGREMWSYLTGRGAAVNYSFVDMVVEVPRDIGPDAPRATWKFNGTLRITTSDDLAAGSDTLRS